MRSVLEICCHSRCRRARLKLQAESVRGSSGGPSSPARFRSRRHRKALVARLRGGRRASMASHLRYAPGAASSSAAAPHNALKLRTRPSSSAWVSSAPRMVRHQVSGGISRNLQSLRSRASSSAALDDAGGGGPPGGGRGPCKTGGSGGNGGDGGAAGENSGDDDRVELLNMSEASAMAQRAGVELPADFVEAAQGGGLWASALQSYLALVSGGGLLTAAVMRLLPPIRDRLLLDPRFLFKVGAEVLIDTGCATIAEVRKRAEHFWDEFDFYMSDIVVGVVLDAVLMTLLAPKAVVGARPKSATASGLLAPIQRLADSVPSAMFAKSVPGMKPYSVSDRVVGFVLKGLEYSLAGMACGLVGQGVANGLVMLKRHFVPDGSADKDLPDVLRTALVWGMFMGISSNARYQVVFGLERVMESLPLIQKMPAVLNAGSVAIRFVNNVIGGEQFIDMARWAGVQ